MSKTEEKPKKAKDSKPKTSEEQIDGHLQAIIKLVQKEGSKAGKSASQLIVDGITGSVTKSLDGGKASLGDKKIQASCMEFFKIPNPTEEDYTKLTKVLLHRTLELVVERQKKEKEQAGKPASTEASSSSSAEAS